MPSCDVCCWLWLQVQVHLSGIVRGKSSIGTDRTGSVKGKVVDTSGVIPGHHYQEDFPSVLVENL